MLWRREDFPTGYNRYFQPLSAPDQLDAFREELQRKASCFDCLVFCVGENGLDLAER